MWQQLEIESAADLPSFIDEILATPGIPAATRARLDAEGDEDAVLADAERGRLVGHGARSSAAFATSAGGFRLDSATGNTTLQVAVVPEIGHLIAALRTPVVSQVLLYGAPALLAGWLLLSIWRPTPDTDDTTQNEEDRS